MSDSTEGTPTDPHEMSASELLRHYEESGSVSALARRFGMKRATAEKLLRLACVPIKSVGFVAPRKLERGSEKHHNWKGGTYRHSSGYIYELAPDHPAAASAKGYVLQHRLVMERKLGRLLTPVENVHHIDGDKTNNDEANLLLTDHPSHMAHHANIKPRDDKGHFV
jgi:hypothetical protein